MLPKSLCFLVLQVPCSKYSLCLLFNMSFVTNFKFNFPLFSYGKKSGMQEKRLFPPNYRTCFDIIKFISKAPLVILGLGKCIKTNVNLDNIYPIAI